MDKQIGTERVLERGSEKKCTAREKSNGTSNQDGYGSNGDVSGRGLFQKNIRGKSMEIPNFHFLRVAIYI